MSLNGTLEVDTVGEPFPIITMGPPLEAVEGFIPGAWRLRRLPNVKDLGFGGSNHPF